MKKIKLAMVVGHRKSDNGAMNAFYDTTEWQLNKILIAMIRTHLNENIEPIYILRDDAKDGYAKLPAKINVKNPDYIIEFHCNAAGNKDAKGCTALYYFKSSKSKEFAEMLNNTVYDTLGIKKLPLMDIKSNKENGFNILKNTNAPCVILEPAFFSNHEDTTNLLSKLGELSKGLAEGLNEFFK